MKYAIVEIGGKQVWFEPKKQYKIDFLRFNNNRSVLLHRILILNNEKNFQIGNPYIENIAVRAKILEQFRDSKLLIYKVKSKKKVRKKQGHRQKLNKLKIEDFLIPTT